MGMTPLHAIKQSLPPDAVAHSRHDESGIFVHDVAIVMDGFQPILLFRVTHGYTLWPASLAWKQPDRSRSVSCLDSVTLQRAIKDLCESDLKPLVEACRAMAEPVGAKSQREWAELNAKEPQPPRGSRSGVSLQRGKDVSPALGCSRHGVVYCLECIPPDPTEKKKGKK